MIAQFALRLVCGMSLMWSIMPRSRVTAGFFRIQMLVVLGLSVLAALTAGDLTAPMGWGHSDSGVPGVQQSPAGPSGASRTQPQPPPILSSRETVPMCAGLAGMAFLGSVFWTLQRRRAGTFLGFLIAGVSAGVLLLGTSRAESTDSFAGILYLVSELSSAAILGSAVTGMLLGHWYVTAPTMSIAPLNRSALNFGAAGLIRLVISGIGLWLAWAQVIGGSYWMWLSLRWVAGILGPLVVFVMVRQILRYKHTQAATGMLFVGVILTFIGEATGLLLCQALKTPL